jgi:hypothetical protein
VWITEISIAKVAAETAAGQSAGRRRYACTKLLAIII